MKVYLPLICVVSLALAEPPVGEGYPSARSSHDYSHDYDYEHDHSNDFQRSHSQEYGPPPVESARSFQENEPSREYLPPSAEPTDFRSSLSQTYGLPNARSGVPHENGLPNSRSLASFRGLSTKYGVPNTRSGPSQTYGASTARSGLSQEYGVPLVRSNNARTPSDQYGVSEQRTLSKEYGVPSQRSFGSALSHSGPPASRNSQSSKIHSLSSKIQQSHSNPRSSTKLFASSKSRSFKGASKFGARSSSTDTGNSAASSYSSNTETQSKTYEAPNQRHLSDTYEVSSAKELSQEYGVPASHASHTTNQKSSAGPSTNSAAARSSPSNTYGAPLARDSMPSDQYGVPDQRSNLSNEGYSYARNGIDGALNEEPASYDFSYKVEDYESGSDFGHTETRQDNRAEGAYFVVLPDGTKQVVEYEADERGFKPRISVEPADFARSAGYDHNAAELARSGEGSY